MGEVWRARDQKLGREVAIKTLPEEFASDEERLARFEREAKLLASLNHPNIATIHGLEEDNGTRFLVLELVEGDTLADRLKRGAIPVEESLKLALQIVEALEAAHEKGVIHRDLKPANIKVTPDGKIKVLDFGLAKAFAGDGTDVNLSQSPTLSMAATQQGVILGTAAYMSPEQARGVTVDKRADIWAFGCVLYEMLTGRQVFKGELMSDVMASVLKSDPDYKGLPPVLHPKLRDVLRRCMEKEPKQRWHDVGDVRVELEQVSADPSGTLVLPAAETFASQSKLPWVAAIMFVAVVAVIATWNLKPEPLPEEKAVVRFPFVLPVNQAFTRTGRPVVAVAPDGSQFVYVANDQLYLKKLDEQEARPIAGADGIVTTPFFSPKGNSIGFFSDRDNQIKKVSVEGGIPVPITPASNPFGASWGPDDRILFGQPGGIMTVPADGGPATMLVATEPGEQADGPQMLPDGETVLFSLTSATGITRWDEAQIVAETPGSGNRKVIWDGGSDARYLETGHLVFALENDLVALRFDPQTLTTTGGPVLIVAGARRADGGDFATGSGQYDVSAQGTLVHIPGGVSTERDLAFLDLNGAPEVFTDEPRDFVFPRFSPDDSRVAVQINDADGSNIWIYEIQDNQWNRITTEGGTRPLWSHDGAEVTFLSGNALWTTPSAPGGTPMLLRGTEVDEPAGPFAWSPDGDVLLFVSGEGIHAWERGARYDNSAPARLIVPGGRLVDFSPDGRFFVYESDRGLYVHPYPVDDAGPIPILTDAATAAVWIRNGQELVYADTGARGSFQVMEVETEPTFDRSNPVQLFLRATRGQVFGRRNYDVTADGQKFVVGVNTGAAARSLQINVVLNWIEELKERVPGP